MKKYNKLPLILGALAGISLLSAGFAGWIVTGATATEASGFVNISVGSVTDNRIKATLVSSEADLQFDAKKGASNGQLQASQDAKEDMEIGGQVKVEFNTPGDTNIGDVLKGFRFDVEYTNPETNKLKTAIASDKFIESPFDSLNGGTIDKENFSIKFDNFTTSQPEKRENWVAPSDSYLKTYYKYSIAEGSKSATLDFKFGFRWGETFGNVNPVNTDINGSTTIENIVKNLNSLKTALDNEKNLLTIKVTPEIN